MNPGQYILYEKDIDLYFVNRVEKFPGGESIKDCIQCGSCTASCPMSSYWKNSPRKIIAMVKAGLKKEVLSSSDIWLCALCYTCTVRCPQKIQITEIMYILRNLAIKEGYVSEKEKSVIMGKLFSDLIYKYGRNQERKLLMKFYRKADIKGALNNMSLGLNLMLKGRMKNGGKVKDIQELRSLIDAVKKEVK